MRVDLEALFVLTPHVSLWCRDALTSINAVLPTHEIDTVRRACHFLAQVLHETGGLRSAVEDLNYSATGLMRTWPNRFRTVEEAERYAHKPRELANKVYGGRLGNDRPDDGWKYRGRGFLQITGRTNYWTVGSVIGLDLLDEPNLAVDPLYALRVACGVWMIHSCNQHADKDDVVAVTKAINGGTIGLSSRMSWLAKVRTVVSE